MNKYIRRDVEKRKQFAAQELKRRALKQLLIQMDDTTPFEDKLKVQYMLNKLPRNSSRVRIRNRCVLTSRARATYRQFKISRLKLRELGSEGFIPGFKKSSW